MNYTDLLQPLPWNMPTIYCLLVLLLPLAGFLFNVLMPKGKARIAAILSSGFILICAAISIYILSTKWLGPDSHSRMEWFSLPGLPDFTIGVLLDDSTALMLVVVTVISFLVHIYSISYMSDDAGYKRYFGFLGFFTFSMLGIVLADNLLAIFIFWEMVGFSSYLLIGHWYHKNEAIRAAKKAFIVNRVGDVGFIIGLAILWVQFNTFDIEALKALMSGSVIENGIWVTVSGHGLSVKWISLAGLCLFLGAMGKSAQFPLQVWLPDAMEGPTPVSALIHAATMVAAGVFLMTRVFVLLDVTALTVIATVGAITAFMGAVAALGQHDIKKVLAYSTISQLGYMLMGIGVGAYDAALFHLFTHAFFKAGLFLSAGAVIYSLHNYAKRSGVQFDAQDMRNMGGLRKGLPITFVAYTVSALALIGIPFFSGFLSKDALLSGAYAWANMMSNNTISWYYIIPDLGFITVILTALYMLRQLLLVFFGNLRIAEGKAIDKRTKLNEVPWGMKLVLMALGLMSFGFIWSINPLSHNYSWFLDGLKIPTIASPGFDLQWQPGLIELTLANHVEVTFISMTMIFLGGLVAWYLYKPGSRYALNYYSRVNAKNKWQELSYNNWYMNALYYSTIQKPVNYISTRLLYLDNKIIDRIIDQFAILNIIIAHIMAWIDRAIIDGFVNFCVFFAGRVGLLAKSMQGGKVQSYIFLALMGVLLFIFWIIR